MNENISPEAVESFANGASENKEKKAPTFDTKNYLNVRLSPGEKKKEITIRLLPIDGGNAVVKIHTHNIPVNKKISESGFKTYICLSKTEGIDREKFGKKCPLCEINWAEYNAFASETDPDLKEEHKQKSKKFRSHESVILRCIERGKENEGVKFWKFNLREDGTDPWNQMYSIYKKRRESGKKKNLDINVFDLNNGKDFTITITEGNGAPTVMDDDEYTPLTTNEAQKTAWLNDSKTWQDVFAVKPYEYLEIVARGNVPWFDREAGKWVEKEFGNQTDVTPVVENAENRVNEEQSITSIPQTASDDLPF